MKSQNNRAKNRAKLMDEHVKKTCKTRGKSIVYHLLAISSLNPESHTKINRFSQNTIKLERSGLHASCCGVPLSENTHKM